MAPIASNPVQSASSLRRRVTVLAGAALVLAACQTPAPYAPRDAHATTGYADQQLAANRYRVTFTGNSATKRDTARVADGMFRRRTSAPPRAKAHGTRPTR